MPETTVNNTTTPSDRASSNDDFVDAQEYPEGSSKAQDTTAGGDTKRTGDSNATTTPSPWVQRLQSAWRSGRTYMSSYFSPTSSPDKTGTTGGADPTESQGDTSPSRFSRWASSAWSYAKPLPSKAWSVARSLYSCTVPVFWNGCKKTYNYASSRWGGGGGTSAAPDSKGEKATVAEQTGQSTTGAATTVLTSVPPERRHSQ